MLPHEVVAEVFPTMGGITAPAETYMPEGYAWVTPTPMPGYSQDTHSIKETTPQLIDDVWTQVWEITELSADELAARFAVEKDALIKAATALRWQKEEGGVTLPNEVRVGTTKDDQNRITSVIANAANSGVESVDFKASTGWVTLTVAEIQFIAGVIARHVQTHFTAERAHHEAIWALETMEQLRSYDLNAGWPE